MRFALALVVLAAGCVDTDTADKNNWLRVKGNADRADICIKAGGMPRPSFWTERIDNCLLPIDKLAAPPPVTRRTEEK